MAYSSVGVEVLVQPASVSDRPTKATTSNMRPLPTSNLSRIGDPRSKLCLYQPPDFDLKFVPIIFVRIQTVATPEHDYPSVSRGTTQQR
jgi:hypothetical protein